MRSSASSTFAERRKIVTRVSGRMSLSRMKLSPLLRDTTSSTVRRFASRKSSEIGRLSARPTCDAFTCVWRCSISRRRCNATRSGWRGLLFSASVKTFRAALVLRWPTSASASASAARWRRSTVISVISDSTRGLPGCSAIARRSAFSASSRRPSARAAAASLTMRASASLRVSMSPARSRALSG